MAYFLTGQNMGVSKENGYLVPSMKLIQTVIAILMWASYGHAQTSPVRIVTEEAGKRVMVYAINESETDYDVKVTISGSNFRQSLASPRFVRVPAASRVFIKPLIPFRDKKAVYSFEVELNDSLSNRSIIREFDKIKLNPPKPIIMYYPRVCGGCDSILSSLEQGNYQFEVKFLSKVPDTRIQLEEIFGGEHLDSLALPVMNIGGKLYRNLESYEQIIQKLD